MGKYKFKELDNGYKLYKEDEVIGTCKFEKIQNHYLIQKWFGEEYGRPDLTEPLDIKPVKEVKSHCKKTLGRIIIDLEGK